MPDQETPLPRYLEACSRADLMALLRSVPDERPPQGWAGQWLDAYANLVMTGGGTFRKCYAETGIGLDHIKDVILDKARLTEESAKKVILGVSTDKKWDVIKEKPSSKALLARIAKDIEYDQQQPKQAAIVEKPADQTEAVAATSPTAGTDSKEPQPAQPEKGIRIRPPFSVATAPVPGSSELSLDRIVKDFTRNGFKQDSKPGPGSPENFKVTRDPEKILSISTELADGLAEQAQNTWGIPTNKTHFIGEIGLLTQHHYVAFFRMRQGREGLTFKTISQIKNPDGSAIDKRTQLFLSSVVNGNPTLPDIEEMASAACELMKFCQKDERNIPKDHIILQEMKFLHTRFPGGKYMLTPKRPNVCRIGNTIVNLMIEKYGIKAGTEWGELSPNNVVDVKSGKRDIAPDSRPGLAVKLAGTFKEIPELFEKLALMFMMTPEKKSPKQLIQEVKDGEITRGQLHKRMRAQNFLGVAEYAEKLFPDDPKFLGAVQEFEKGAITTRRHYAEKVADFWFKGLPEEESDIVGAIDIMTSRSQDWARGQSSAGKNEKRLR